MRPTVWLLAIILLSSITSSTFAQQKQTDEQRLRLNAAKVETNRFLERLRETWDFRKTWAEFRSKHEPCGISVFDRSLGLKANPTLKGIRISEALQKEHFMAVWNFYLLGGSYIFSLSPLTNRGGPDTELIPPSSGFTSLKAFEKKATFVKLFDHSEDRELQTLQDVRKSIDEMNEFSVLLKNHMPTDAMNNNTWRDAVDYFHRSFGPDEEVIEEADDPNFSCAIKRAPLYSISLTDQYFVWVHEDGKMKLLTLARLVD